MKTFTLSSWSFSSQKPTTTGVTVALLNEIAPGVNQTTTLQFDVDGRYDGPNEEGMLTQQEQLHAAVKAKLEALNLLA